MRPADLQLLAPTQHPFSLGHSYRELIDAGASPADLLYRLFIFVSESMPTVAGLLPQLMRKAAELGGLQLGGSSGPTCICRQPVRMTA